MLNSKRLAKLVLVVFLASQFFNLSLLFPKKLDSANLTSVKDTLTDNRLSFRGALDAGNTEGSSLIRIQLVGDSPPSWATSVKNYNLFPGDSLKVGTGTYTVDDIVDDTPDDLIQLTAGLGSGDADEDDAVIATQSANHALSFTSVTAIENGAIRISIQSASSEYNDGLPDATGFDFGAMTGGDVTCPSGGGVTWESATATAAASYHTFECRYSGTLSIGAYTMTIGGTNKLINPSPSSTGKTIGTADTHTFIVQHLPWGYSTVGADSTTGKVAVVESVRVTATIEPSLTFTITGEDSDSGNRCGVTRTAASPDSTAATVPFGTISLGTFNDAQQKLSCVTNASSGYAVTVISDDQLSIGGDHSTEIPNTDCDSENCSDTTSGEWSSENDASGFGFSMENIDANTITFQYSDSSGNCTGTYCARMIPSTATAGESGTTDDSDAVLEIFKNTSTPTTTEDIYVCYRLTASTVQSAGDYENYVTYVATATF